MFVSKGEFAKLLQDNERRVYWTLGDVPGAVVHEWRALEDGRLLLKEVDMPHDRLYWASDELV